MQETNGKLLQAIQSILTHSPTLIGDFYVIGSPARKSNNRISVGNRNIKGIDAQTYSKIFHKQLSRILPKIKEELPLVRSDYFWVFDIWYKNPLSDVSIELTFDLLEEHGIVINDNKIRNYMCLGEALDKEFPRTRIRIYGA